MPQGIPRSAELDNSELHAVTEVRAAIKTQGTDSMLIPCTAISVGTTGAYTLTNPDGTTVVGVILTAGVMYWFSTRVLPTGVGTVWVYY